MSTDLTPSDDDRPILVTGATGFIGLEVCRQLSSAGVPTRAMFRRRHRAALLAPLDLDAVCANLSEAHSLRRAVDDCRAVIHLAGRATFEPYARLAPTMVDGTEALAAAAASAGADRFVFGSSAFVHGPEDGMVVSGTSTTTPLLDYGRAKVDAEAVLAGAAIDSVAIRLPHVYGWNDLLFGLLRSGYLPFPADLDAHFPRLHVADAARALIAAVDSPVSGPVDIADDLSATWRHFFDVVTTYLPTARILPLPAVPVRIGLQIIEKVPVRKPSMLAADTIRGWNQQLSIEPGSLGAFGLTPRFETIETGIPDVLDSMLPYRWRHPVFDRRAA